MNLWLLLGKVLSSCLLVHSTPSAFFNLVQGFDLDVGVSFYISFRFPLHYSSARCESTVFE